MQARPNTILSAGAAGNFLAPISQLSSNAFKTVIDIDVNGSYNTLKATLPHLLESAKKNPNNANSVSSSTGGRIIFVSATLHYVGNPLQAHVMAAKAAIDALSSSVCLEFGPYGITSNIIAPGPIAGTEGMARLSGDEGRKKISQTIPLGRYGQVKEIADSTVYVFSDAGNYVNGSVIVVDGGSWRAPQLWAIADDMTYPKIVMGAEMPKGAKSGRRESKI